MTSFRSSQVASLLFAAGMMLGACGDSAPPPESTSPAPAAPKVARAHPAPNAGAAEKPKALELTESDFVESDDNRDPFHSYLSEFLTPQTRTAKIQRKVLLQRYGLDELKLIAVIAGNARPRAMFRDPTGLGVTVTRGDYISKSAGKVKQILENKVIVQIQEQAEDGQAMADRVIELHPSSPRGREFEEER